LPSVSVIKYQTSTTCPKTLIFVFLGTTR